MRSTILSLPCPPVGFLARCWRSSPGGIGAQHWWLNERPATILFILSWGTQGTRLVQLSCFETEAPCIDLVQCECSYLLNPNVPVGSKAAR